MRERELRGCNSAVVVRNPWNRMLSWYSFCRSGYHGEYTHVPSPRGACLLARDSISFDTWLTAVLDLNNRHLGMLPGSPGVWAFDSAAAWVLTRNGSRELIKYMSDFAQLNLTAAHLLHKQSRPPLPHLNGSNRTKSELKMNADAHSLICTHYAYEIQRFSFTYGGVGCSSVYQFD
mmetsp:Transcript_4607/g.9994  ORF Transcript_4607/g.9994 Transcript_4607/m.9994 type:complete len:176 (-) Transcript_4607:290-817(-)